MFRVKQQFPTFFGHVTPKNKLKMLVTQGELIVFKIFEHHIHMTEKLLAHPLILLTVLRLRTTALK